MSEILCGFHITPSKELLLRNSMKGIPSGIVNFGAENIVFVVFVLDKLSKLGTLLFLSGRWRIGNRSLQRSRLRS